MFSKKERRIIGQLLFEVWTNPEVSAELLRNPDATLNARGIVDKHGRKFEVLMDTDNSINLTLPWLPAPLRNDPVNRLPSEEQQGQARGLLRIEWTEAEVAKLFTILVRVWNDPKEAAKLLQSPYEYLSGQEFAASSLAKLGGRRIIANEASRHIAHFVVPIPPPGIKQAIKDLYELKYEVMCSASFCGCDDDCDDSDYGGDDKKGDDKKGGGHKK